MTVRVRDADSAAVRFHLAGVASGMDSVTPAVRTMGDSAAIPVLGLLPARRYVLHAAAYWMGGRVDGEPVQFETD